MRAPVLTARGGGDVSASSSSPTALRSLLAGMVELEVDAADVECGDLVSGIPGRVVDEVRLTRAGWTYLDIDGVIDIRLIGSRVKVIRPESDVDDCPAFGILRPPMALELVR